jgi:cytochrome c556
LEAKLQLKSCIAALMMVGAGALAVAQTKVTTPEDLDKAMKKVGPALQAANKALASGAPAEAAKQLAVMKQAVIDSREFWVMHKKDDAIEANKLTVDKIEAVEKMLSAATPDTQAIQASLKQDVGAACRQCHEKYRVRDAENNWVLKPGSIGN